jgi:hypothetical protein
MSKINVSEICGLAFNGIDHAQSLIKQIEEFHALQGEQTVIVDWVDVEIIEVSSYLYYSKLIHSKQLETYIEHTNNAKLKRFMSLLQEKLMT